MLFTLLLAIGLLDGSAIQGAVRAAGSLEPIAGAAVAIPALGRTVVTDPHGYFVLNGIPAGRWQVEATALGYEKTGLTIASAGKGLIRLDFELVVRPVRLAGVEVEGAAEEGGILLPTAQVAGPAAVRLNGPALRVLPGLVEPDVLRALQTLPSVGSISDFSSALYVRGGSADQNLITLDGVPLFNPYHLGGIFSAISADAVSSVDVWPGAAPAQSGDRLSGTVAIHTREGGKDRVRASGAVGLLSTYATVDGPLPGGRGSFLLAGRRTYLDAATDAAYALHLMDFTIPYGFSDAYLKATRQVGSLGSLTLSAYLNREGVQLPSRMREEMHGDVDFGWGSKMLSLAYRQPIGGSFLLQARLGYSDFRGTFYAWKFQWNGPVSCNGWGSCDYSGAVRDSVSLADAHTTARDALANADLTWFGPAHTVRAGVQLDGYLFDAALVKLEDVEELYFQPFALTHRPRTLAAYLEDSWRPLDRLQLRAGVRLMDAARHGRAWLPRLGASFELSPTLTVSLGGGRYAQVLRSLRDDESMVASLVAYEILAAQPERVGLATGEDLVGGVSWSGARTSIRLDAYARRMAGLVLAPEPAEPMRTPPLVIDSFRVGTGAVRGVELTLGHRLGRADLMLGYALSSAERSVGGERFPPRFERRHLLDAGASVPWGERALYTARLAVGSGQPTTPPIGLADPLRFDPVEQRWTGGGGTILLGEHNSARLPGYLRLDVAARKRYDKRWFGREMTVTPFMQILNVLNTRNALFGEADPITGPQLAYWPQLPFLPTFGVEWKF